MNNLNINGVEILPIIRSDSDQTNTVLRNYMDDNEYQPDSRFLASVHKGLLSNNLNRNDNLLTIFNSNSSHTDDEGDFSDRKLLREFNMSPSTHQSRDDYFSGILSPDDGDWTGYGALSKLLVINIMLFAKSKGSLESMRENLSRCQNNAVLNTFAPMAIINLLGYIYPIFMSPSINCSQLAGELIIISHNFVDVPLINALQRENSLMSSFRNLILGTLGDTIYRYPTLTALLTIGSTASVCAVVGYPVGPPLLDFCNSWLVRPALTSGSILIRSIVERSANDRSNPVWLSALVNYFSNPSH